MKKLIYCALSASLLLSCTKDEPKPIAYPSDSIVLQTHAFSMVPGEERVLHVDYATTYPFTWSTADPNTLRISEDGVITAIQPGQTTAYVTCSEWTTATDSAIIYVRTVPNGEWLPNTYLDFTANRASILSAIDSLGYERLSGDSVGFRTVNSTTLYGFTYDAVESAHCNAIYQWVYGWRDSITAGLMERYSLEDSVIHDQSRSYYFLTTNKGQEIRVIAYYGPAMRGKNERSEYYIMYYLLSQQ